ncbi:MAG: hypothetical protein JWQ88_528 [Rhodoferax sp.]|nr:hypothetical protein [Rhodoferax sp.]
MDWIVWMVAGAVGMAAVVMVVNAIERCVDAS